MAPCPSLRAPRGADTVLDGGGIELKSAERRRDWVPGAGAYVDGGRAKARYFGGVEFGAEHSEDHAFGSSGTGAVYSESMK